MKDRRSCRAAELWQGIPSVVIPVAGTMVHQNREPQGVIYNAGASKATEINTQAVPVGTSWWTGPLKVIQSTWTAPKAPETQLGKVHLLPRAQELTQHKAGNHRDQSAGFAVFSAPFHVGQHLHTQSVGPGSWGEAELLLLPLGKQQEPSHSSGSSQSAPFKKPHFSY